MPAKYTVTPEVALESAVRAEVMGYSGVEFQGRIVSSQELRRMFQPIHPLSMNAQYTSNGSDSSDRD